MPFARVRTRQAWSGTRRSIAISLVWPDAKSVSSVNDIGRRDIGIGMLRTKAYPSPSPISPAFLVVVAYVYGSLNSWSCSCAAAMRDVGSWRHGHASVGVDTQLTSYMARMRAMPKIFTSSWKDEVINTVLSLFLFSWLRGRSSGASGPCLQCASPLFSGNCHDITQSHKDSAGQ